MKSEKMIPEVYAQSMDMRTICRIIDIEMDLLSYYTNHILDCYSPEHCQEHLLPHLAEHIGFDYNERKTPMYNRVVLKHFVRNLIRYRGSRAGIANAAAIDVRYRQVHSAQRLNPQTGVWEADPQAGTLVPMVYNEGVAVDKTWIDTDHANGIIYLFIISPGYFPPIPNNASEELKEELSKERMRRLLDLSHLQEYVRPAGMYLLPMVAEKVDARSDLTVKAIRIPAEERNTLNGVLGTPNASLEHPYDRMHFAKVENPADSVNTEPWLRTLYHSQVAGQLTHEYFDRPVYSIEGKFLYYDHDELLNIYSQIMNSPAGTLGMKVGDTLYNPNLFTAPQDYNYGEDPANEPLPEDYPQFLSAGDADDGTNKNLLINLFQVDEQGASEYTSVDEVYILGKTGVQHSPIPYDTSTNTTLSGTDAIYTVHNPEDPEDGDIVP